MDKVKEKIVIGIGNAARQDDGLGPYIIERLRQECLSDEVDLSSTFGDGFALMEWWKDRKKVVLVDCVSSGILPGTIHRIDAIENPIPKEVKPYSTHGFSLPEIIELARNLGAMPQQLIFYGVEGINFGLGYGLSEKVEQSVDELVAQIVEEIRRKD